MTKALLFENVPCGRCGGSGRYSYNQMHGDRCYGCGGKGVKLTKRGRAAQDYLNALRSVRADEIKVGDLVLCEVLSSASFSRVDSIDIGNAKEQGVYSGDGQYQQVKIVTKKLISYLSPSSSVRKGFTGEEKDAQVKLALAYQETLTKVGKPKK